MFKLTSKTAHRKKTPNSPVKETNKKTMKLKRWKRVQTHKHDSSPVKKTKKTNASCITIERVFLMIKHNVDLPHVTHSREPKMGKQQQQRGGC